MNSTICKNCGLYIDDPEIQCPNCGTLIQDDTEVSDTTIGSLDERLRDLLALARQCQQHGDLATAICYAKEALAFRNDCSTTHALLGHLYEQQGNVTASRYHFQAALHVPTIASRDDHLAFLSTRQNTQQAQSGVMMLVLIGCVLFSGLAAILAFRPNKHSIERSTVLQLPVTRMPIASTPRWTWNVPSPVPVHHADTPTSSVAVSDTNSNTALHSETHSADLSGQEPPFTAIKVLGPSAHAIIAACPNERLSIEAADQAYFRGEYDRAITMYEALIGQDSAANSRIYQDLAWCYQQLGNSEKAAEYLDKAIQGYRALLASDPNSVTTQQALDTCTAALHSMLQSRKSEDSNY